MVKVLPAKADDLGLLPKTHVLESELTPSSDFTRMLESVCLHTNKYNTFLKCK